MNAPSAVAWPAVSWDDSLDRTIEETAAALVRRQSADGHFVFELEADATIPSEYILLNHYLGTPDESIERKLTCYLRDTQGEDGGWPLYHRGEAHVSASVKAYYALKLAGDPVDAPHMCRARDRILALGGAARCNVFTRIALALFGQIPWRAVPVMRVEVMLLPRWFPFHMDKVSYWSRTVMVPLLILYSLKPQARNPRGVGIAELFTEPADQVRRYHVNPTGHILGDVLVGLDTVARMCEPFFPRFLERRAIAKALDFVAERLNGENGLGAIFPAMANAVMAFDALGYAPDHPWYATARRALDALLVIEKDRAWCQPCLSPVWDTALAAHALMETGLAGDDPVIARTMTWLEERQVLDVTGDWAVQRPGLRPGGWAFQYANPHYPDVDDTAVVVMALDRARRDLPPGEKRNGHDNAIARGTEWTLGMQCRNGGWAAFDAENEQYHLNHIPFADHGALLDPPTADVSARCLGMLGQLGTLRTAPAMERGLDWLRRQQEADGSWFGRWGTNYIYGTWSALNAFAASGEDMSAPHIRLSVVYLQNRQRPDGGWGEECASYWSHRKNDEQDSTPSQTAWALLGLMAAGEVESAEVARGVRFLLSAPRQGARWEEDLFTAVGFPRVFYLRYHGYAAYFPLWALARYRTLKRGNRRRVDLGI
ncbi:MAG: squalene-hopene cyclase [Rhodospirillaceae bacterium]|nr:MAG: squalene-hopene cyclase [Rhodospirillaceae bacterium]